MRESHSRSILGLVLLNELSKAGVCKPYSIGVNSPTLGHCEIQALLFYCYPFSQGSFKKGEAQSLRETPG